MRSFLLWGLALVVLRGAVVLSLGDAFFYGEELEKATAGKAMLDGLGIPHHQLAYHYYEGGGFVASHLKAAAFYVFGESVLANKWVAIMSCLAVLWAGCWACAQAFGRSSAHIFAALYVLAPASVQKLSLISLGIHHEACFFVLLALGLAAALMERQTVKEGVLLGLCLGFGVYFSWVVALAAVACALSLTVRWRQLLDGGVVLACVGGALVGASPLLLMWAEVGDAVLNIHGTELVGGAARPTSEVLREFLRSIYLDGALGGVLGAIAWPTAALAALWIGFRADADLGRGWSRAFACFALFAGVFLLAYLYSAFVQGEVYHFFLMLRLVPLWIVSVVLISAVVGRGWDEQGRASLASWGLAALLAVGAIGTVESFGARPISEWGQSWGLLRAERGYAYPSYFAKLIPHLDGGPKDRLEVLLCFEEEEPKLLREGIAQELFRRERLPGESLQGDFIVARDLVESVEPGRFEDYVRGFGPLLVDWRGEDLSGCLEQLEAAGGSDALGRGARAQRAWISTAGRRQDTRRRRRPHAWRPRARRRLRGRAGLRSRSGLAPALDLAPHSASSLACRRLHRSGARGATRAGEGWLRRGSARGSHSSQALSCDQSAV